VAEITDDNGNVRRLAKEEVVFSVEGEGRIMGDASVSANPRAVEWGSAPILVQSTNQAGEIRVIAHSLYDRTYAPAADTITFHSIPADISACYSETASDNTEKFHPTVIIDKQKMTDAERHKILKEVEQQQKDFGIK